MIVIIFGLLTFIQILVLINTIRINNLEVEIREMKARMKNENISD